MKEEDGIVIIKEEMDEEEEELNSIRNEEINLKKGEEKVEDSKTEVTESCDEMKNEAK